MEANLCENKAHGAASVGLHNSSGFAIARKLTVEFVDNDVRNVVLGDSHFYNTLDRNHVDSHTAQNTASGDGHDHPADWEHSYGQAS